MRSAAVAHTSPFVLYNSAIVNDYNNSAVAVIEHDDATNIYSERVSALSTFPNPALNVPYIFVNRFDGTNNVAYLNGVAGSTFASTGTFNISNALVGARYTASTINTPYNGYIGEIIVINEAVSDKRRIEIQDYLSKKWKIKI